MQSNMKTLKIRLTITCLLLNLAVGLPCFSGANFFMKSIQKFPRYSITKEGLVYSHIKKRFLKSCTNGDGYPLVSLITEDGEKKSVNVHRLVAEAFVENPNPIEFDQVNHIDSNRGNPHYKNLEWGNQSLNILHAFRVMKNKRHGSKLTFEQAEEIRQMPLSTYKIAKIYNVCQATIQKIKSGKTYNEEHKISRYAGL